MFEKLKQLQENALATDSNFHVASIIVDEAGNIYEGVNVEYVIPSNAICAERNAISTAITKGFKFGTLKEVHVYGESKNNFNPDSFTTPCGACRQAIVEASNCKAKVFLYNSKGEIKEYSIEELLPLAFTGSLI